MLANQKTLGRLKQIRLAACPPATQDIKINLEGRQIAIDDANYGPLKKPREKDYYSPNGVMGKRPDRATLVYCNKIRELFKEKKNINR